jgi:hypothetical protein
VVQPRVGVGERVAALLDRDPAEHADITVASSVAAVPGRCGRSAPRARSPHWLTAPPRTPTAPAARSPWPCCWRRFGRPAPTSRSPHCLTDALPGYPAAGLRTYACQAAMPRTTGPPGFRRRRWAAHDVLSHISVCVQNVRSWLLASSRCSALNASVGWAKGREFPVPAAARRRPGGGGGRVLQGLRWDGLGDLGATGYQPDDPPGAVPTRRRPPGSLAAGG